MFDNAWMESREIIHARSIRDLSFSAFHLDRSQENFTTYRKYRNRAKLIIQRARRKHFSGIFRNLDTKKFWVYG